MPKLKHEKKETSALNNAAGPSIAGPSTIVQRGRKRPLLLALAIVLVLSWLIFLAVLALGGY